MAFFCRIFNNWRALFHALVRLFAENFLFSQPYFNATLYERKF